MSLGRLRPRAGALGERDFALFFLGYAVSLAGSGMVPVALTFAILGQGYGASGVGSVLAVQTATMTALILVGGSVADRLPRRRVMVAADAVRGLAQGLLAVSLLAGHTPLWLFAAVAAALGAGQAFFGPALSGLVTETAPAAHLQGANALLGMARWAGQVLGPALAGLLAAAGGAPWAIGIDALSYAVGGACLLALRPPRAAAGARPEPFLRHLRLGWAAFASRAWLWIIVLQFGFYHMLVLAPTMMLGALVADRHLGGASAWGTVLSGEGAGAILGGLAVMRARPRRPLVWATLGTFSGLPLLVSLARGAPLWAVVPAGAAWGAGLAVFTVLFDTTLQRCVPAEALSRVSSYDYLGSFALAPAGYALSGPLADRFGVAPTLEASALWLLASSGLVLALPAIRHLRGDPAPPPAPPP